MKSSPRHWCICYCTEWATRYFKNTTDGTVTAVCDRHAKHLSLMKDLAHGIEEEVTENEYVVGKIMQS